MEPFRQQKTKSTPEITFDKSQEIFEITGWSKPENTLEFYGPVINWLTEYSSQPNAKTVFNFNLEYFNSSTSKIILQIIRVLEVIHENGQKLEINWYYNDEDNLEAGEAYKSLTEVSFNCIKTTNN